MEGNAAMNAALAFLGIQGVLGAYDNFRNHEFREGLPHRSRQRSELLLHGAREGCYLIVFPTMAWFEWRGWLSFLLAAIIVGEIVITCWDFVEEDRTRKLSANERVLHTVLTLNYGIFLALLAPEMLAWSHQPAAIVVVDRGVWSWLMTVYSLGVLVFGIREVSSGLAMRKQSRTGPLPALHNRIRDLPLHALPAPLRDFYCGAGIRTAAGPAEVRVGHGLARVLLQFIGLEMTSGRQHLIVSFEPDGTGELWHRTFTTGQFTSRFEVDDTSQHALIELFGPFSFYYDFTTDADSATWSLRRVRLFGVSVPAALAPRINAREWISPQGSYEMSAEVSAPLLGHLLSYSATLTRQPPLGPDQSH
jgi:hypothetical protein